MRYLRWYLPTKLHSMRIARDGQFPSLPDYPLLIYVNHPSWWDPLIAFWLADKLLPHSRHYAPIDERALEAYSVLGKLGLFWIELDSRRGSAKFLRMAERILSEPDAVLWVTAEGRFTDPRERPVQLKPGIAHVAHRQHKLCVLPLAWELAYWQESKPEVLMRFGQPLVIEQSQSQSVEQIHEALLARHEANLDALARSVIARDEQAFDTIMGGSAGVGGAYDWWRRLRAWMRGRKFEASHEGGLERASAKNDDRGKAVT
jgi:1-acyl-sn-glycerol-3-phosphate acyltransferase